MNETTITSVEAMRSMPNLDSMKVSIVLGIVIIKSVIGIGSPEQPGNLDLAGQRQRRQRNRDRERRRGGRRRQRDPTSKKVLTSTAVVLHQIFRSRSGA
jgi:hypothetical protein